MNYFLQGIYYDLRIRVGNLLAELSLNSYHSDIQKTFVPQTIQELRKLHSTIADDIKSGDLEFPQLYSYYLRRYITHYNNFQLIEAYKYQVIIKYSDTESYLNKKVNLIYDQIKCMQKLPVITTITNTEEYYWAHPLYGLIAVPLGEEKSLLNLPDLFHEIAHLIYKQHKIDLIGEFLKTLSDYYEEQKRLVREEDQNPDLIHTFDYLLNKWQENWLEEFVCDMIATYLTGAAYGWTNLKISAFGSGREVTYMATEYHPSDEARMRGIFIMLEKMKLSDDLDELNKTWEEFVKLIKYSIVDHYEFHFPQELIVSLADEVYDGCVNIGLVSYIDQVKEMNRPISLILNEAWQKIREKSNDYESWENKTVEEIRAMLK